MGYKNNSQQFPLQFPISWLLTVGSPIVQDTTNERDLPEHLDWRAKFIPLPKTLRALK